MAAPISKQVITNATLASATPLTVPAGANVAVVQPLGLLNVNYFTDGSTPTTGTTGDGKKLTAGSELTLTSGLASIKFIREADATDGRLVVEYFGGAV